MTKADREAIAELVAAASRANAPVAEKKEAFFASWPGGAAFPIALLLGLTIFLVKDSFGDFKLTRGEVNNLSTNQQIILKTVNRLELGFEALQAKTDKRYTSEDADQDFQHVGRRIEANHLLATNNKDRLDQRNVFMSETTASFKANDARMTAVEADIARLYALAEALKQKQ